MVQKQSIVNFSCYRSKSYASVVFRASEVPFLGKEEDAAFCPFLYCILFIDSIAKCKSLNFLVFHTLGGILSKSTAFLLLILVGNTLNSSSVNGLMFC